MIIQAMISDCFKQLSNFIKSPSLKSERCCSSYSRSTSLLQIKNSKFIAERRDSSLNASCNFYSNPNKNEIANVKYTIILAEAMRMNTL